MDALVMYASQTPNKKLKSNIRPLKIPCSASGSCLIKQRPYIGPPSHSKAHISSPLLRRIPFCHEIALVIAPRSA